MIQEDELCLPSGFKGNWKRAANLGIDKEYAHVLADYHKYGSRDHPHGRGSKDRKRDLSRDKAFIAITIYDGQNVIGKPIGRSNGRSDGLHPAFSS